MATFLDIGLLKHFIVIFPFLLVFVGTYAILNKLKILGDDPSINAIIAFAIAAMFLFIQDAVILLTVLTPWFILVVFILFFTLMLFQFLGVQEKTIQDVMDTDWHSPHWIIVSIVLVIVIAAGSQVYGPRLAEFEGVNDQGQITTVSEGVSTTPTTPGALARDEFSGRVKDVLFHPKVVGMLILLLIMTFAIRTLAAEEEGSSSKGKKGK